MIKLTKLNGKEVVVNVTQIQAIETIPESKIIFVNKDYLIVRESTDEIIERAIDFSAKTCRYIIIDPRKETEAAQAEETNP